MNFFQLSKTPKMAKKAAESPVKGNRTNAKKSTSSKAPKPANPVKGNRTNAKKSTGTNVLKVSTNKISKTKAARLPKIAYLHLMCVLDMLTNHSDTLASVIHINGGQFIAKTMGEATRGYIQMYTFDNYDEAKKIALDFVKDIPNIHDLRGKDMLTLEWQNTHSLNALFAQQLGEKERLSYLSPTLNQDGGYTATPPEQPEEKPVSMPREATVIKQTLQSGHDAANREVALIATLFNGDAVCYDVEVNNVSVFGTTDEEKAKIEYYERLEHAGQ
jgi:hypothetical protein